jgi:hypothetical protein
MDRSYASGFYSWTTFLPFICHTQDFLNLLHNPKILYLFFITFQAFPRDYGSLLVVHLILVGYSIVRSSSFFHDLLYFFFLHHDWIQGLLLISFIHLFHHFFVSCQCFPPSPMHVWTFSCLRPLSLHLCYIVTS